jgi:pilus assembly protein CpaF
MKEELQQIKNRLKKEILDKLEVTDFGYSTDNKDELQKKVDNLLNTILRLEREYPHLNRSQKDDVISEVVSELIGLGPIEQLLKDPQVLEIMINGPHQIYFEKEGRIVPTPIKFNNQEHLMYFVDKILAPIGRRVTELDPYVDARLADGSRVNIVRSPIALRGPIVTIRKFSKYVLTMEDLTNLGTLNKEVALFLEACVKARLNILISGGAGSGKTTTLNVLGSFIPKEERIIVIEDIAELKIDKEHVINLETRPANIEGKGEITIRSLVKNALHMRPDRIIIGEVRADEVLDMLQAMNTGHDGSMATLHANSPEEALERLEMLTLMGAANITTEVAKKQIIYAINLIIHLVRLSDGSRKIMRICEVAKEKTGDFSLRDIFILEGSGDSGTRHLRFIGIVPNFYSRLKQSGFAVEPFEKR